MAECKICSCEIKDGERANRINGIVSHPSAYHCVVAMQEQRERLQADNRILRIALGKLREAARGGTTPFAQSAYTFCCAALGEVQGG